MGSTNTVNVVRVNWRQKGQQVITLTSGSKELQLTPFKQEVRQQRIEGTTLERLTFSCPSQQQSTGSIKMEMLSKEAAKTKSQPIQLNEHAFACKSECLGVC